MRSRA
jgi:hypothetical protein